MSKTKAEAGIDQRVIKALGHPLRQRILRYLNERVASPSRIATELGEPLGNVAYHVKILLESDAVELVKTVPARGAVEHFYRATARPFLDDAQWARLPDSTRRALFNQNLQQIWDHLAAAARSGGLDDPRTHISWTTLELDQEAYDELADRLAETLELAMRLHSEAAARLAGLSAEERAAAERRTELALLHFHRDRARNQAGGKRARRRGSRRSADATR